MSRGEEHPLATLLRRERGALLAFLRRRGATEAEAEAQAASSDPTVAGRLLLRNVVLPACLTSLYGGEVDVTNRGQTVRFGRRTQGLTLRADEGGRMNACLKGARAQAAMWNEVMINSGINPVWEV